MNAGLRMG